MTEKQLYDATEVEKVLRTLEKNFMGVSPRGKEQANVVAFVRKHMYKADLLLYVKQKDYGPMPQNGKLITLDKKRDYRIKSCSLKAGVYRMELERIRG